MPFSKDSVDNSFGSCNSGEEKSLEVRNIIAPADVYIRRAGLMTAWAILITPEELCGHSSYKDALFPSIPKTLMSSLVQFSSLWWGYKQTDGSWKNKMHSEPDLLPQICTFSKKFSRSWWVLVTWLDEASDHFTWKGEGTHCQTFTECFSEPSQVAFLEMILFTECEARHY